jgi:hypothetical protein
MAHTGVCHDWVEYLPPKVCNAPGYYCTISLPNLIRKNCLIPLMYLLKMYTIQKARKIQSVQARNQWIMQCWVKRMVGMEQWMMTSKSREEW